MPHSADPRSVAADAPMPGSMSSSGAPNAKQNPLPRATALETVQIVGDVQLPTVAKGPIIRRPKVVAGAERLGLEARAVKRMQRVAEKYGKGPLMLSVPGKNMALVLDPEHVHRVLEGAPEPFAPAETMKRHALKHFEPEAALVSHGYERQRRREVNEQALDHGHPIHQLAQQFMPAVREEAEQLLKAVDAAGGRLDYSTYFNAWFRLVNRVVLGDAYRDDDELIDLLETQRARGNWAFLRPVDQKARAEILRRIGRAMDKAEPGSIAALMAQMDLRPEDSPEQQVPQWLFAFDPAGMSSYRALALLAAHQDRLDSVRLQITEEAQESTPVLPLLRSTVLESLRLWATTPMILRETTREVEFEHGVMPEGTSVLIFAPFFHRDERNLDFAHRFAPEVWDHPRTREEWPLVPFSAGPGICPGRHLVLLLTSNFIAEIVGSRNIGLTSHILDPDNLPALLNNFSLTFQLTAA